MSDDLEQRVELWLLDYLHDPKKREWGPDELAEDLSDNVAAALREAVKAAYLRGLGGYAPASRIAQSLQREALDISLAALEGADD